MAGRVRTLVSDAVSTDLGRRALFGGLVALAACAPMLKPGLSAEAATHSPANNSRPELTADSFVSYDGTRLPLKAWPAQDASGVPVEPWAVVAGLHGFNDTAAESFCRAGPAWARQGVATYAFDQRGFGRTSSRGHWAGERAMTEDVRIFCSLLRQRHPNAVLAVAGESMGGAVAAAAFGSHRPPDADRVVLLSPAVWGWDQQPALNTVGLKLLNRLNPELAVALPKWLVDDEACTDDADMLRRMDADPDEIAVTRVEAAYGLVSLMQSAERRIGRIKAPTLYLYGGQDRMVPAPAAYAAAGSLGPNGRTAYYPEGWHLLARDLNTPRVLGDITAYLRDPAAPFPSRPGAIPAPALASEPEALRG